MTVGGLVLAAGAGRRLGAPKALVRVDGELLADRAARTLSAAGCEPVVVVVGAAAGAVRAQARLEGAETVYNADWDAGISGSLRTGLAALRGRVEAAVIVLADQPGVTVGAVRRVLAAWESGACRAATATFEGVQQPPVALGADVWEEVVEAAHGDVGARAWLRSHPEEVREVPCGDVADAADLDTPADLARHGAARGPEGRWWMPAATPSVPLVALGAMAALVIWWLTRDNGDGDAEEAG